MENSKQEVWFLMDEVIIVYKREAQEQKDKLGENEAAMLTMLEQDMRETQGKPFGRGWSSLSELSDGKMHCHLKHKTVVKWTVDKNKVKGNTITTCKVHYVGKRDNAYRKK